MTRDAKHHDDGSHDLCRMNDGSYQDSSEAQFTLTQRGRADRCVRQRASGSRRTLVYFIDAYTTGHMPPSILMAAPVI